MQCVWNADVTVAKVCTYDGGAVSCVYTTLHVHIMYSCQVTIFENVYLLDQRRFSLHVLHMILQHGSVKSSRIFRVECNQSKFVAYYIVQR